MGRRRQWKVLFSSDITKHASLCTFLCGLPVGIKCPQAFFSAASLDFCLHGVTTGRKRRCGWLDLVLLRYSTMINGFTSSRVAAQFGDSLEVPELCSPTKQQLEAGKCGVDVTPSIRQLAMPFAKAGALTCQEADTLMGSSAGSGDLVIHHLCNAAVHGDLQQLLNFDFVRWTGNPTANGEIVTERPRPEHSGYIAMEHFSNGTANDRQKRWHVRRKGMAASASRARTAGTVRCKVIRYNKQNVPGGVDKEDDEWTTAPETFSSVSSTETTRRFEFKQNLWRRCATQQLLNLDFGFCPERHRLFSKLKDGRWTGQFFSSRVAAQFGDSLEVPELCSPTKQQLEAGKCGVDVTPSIRQLAMPFAKAGALTCQEADTLMGSSAGSGDLVIHHLCNAAVHGDLQQLLNFDFVRWTGNPTANGEIVTERPRPEHSGYIAMEHFSNGTANDRQKRWHVRRKGMAASASRARTAGTVRCKVIRYNKQNVPGGVDKEDDEWTTAPETFSSVSSTETTRV
uniref:Uncharacterized protein n=1 Tax=Globodera rostochiensis TaxID=31243 RepID=A0A914GW57_GLORO